KTGDLAQAGRLRFVLISFDVAPSHILNTKYQIPSTKYRSQEPFLSIPRARAPTSPRERLSAKPRRQAVARGRATRPPALASPGTAPGLRLHKPPPPASGPIRALRSRHRSSSPQHGGLIRGAEPPPWDPAPASLPRSECGVSLSCSPEYRSWR